MNSNARLVAAVSMLFLIMLGVAATKARSAEINFGATLQDADGEPIKEGEKPLTLGRAALMALTITLPDDANMTGEEKFKLGQLANRVYTDKPVDLSAEEIATLKKRIGKAFNSLVVFRAWPLLDPPVR